MEEVRLLPHTAQDTTEAHSLEEVRDRYFSNDELGNSIIGFDFDHTMVEDDVGIQVFLQTLLDPHYWNDDYQDFEILLLPSKYKKLLIRGAAGKVKDLPQTSCQFALDLTDDISALYQEIRRWVKSGHFPDEYSIHNAISHPLINEFARKMIALDRAMISMDRVFSRKFNGAFLLRTRFFRNRSIRDVRDITLRVWECTGKVVELVIDKSPKTNGHTKKIPFDHPEIDTDPLTIHLSPRVNKSTLEIARSLLAQPKTPRPSVITTNHPIIADTVIQTTDWIDPLYRNGHLIHVEQPLVRGTLLERDKTRKRLKGKAKGKPVYGEEKRRIAQEVAEHHRRIFRLAIGDSFGDLAMGHEAILNNGAFFVVTEGGSNPANPQEAVERTRQKFHDDFVATLGQEDFARNIAPHVYYILPENLL